MTLFIKKATSADIDTLTAFNLQMSLETEKLKLSAGTVKAGVAAVINDHHKGFYLLAAQADQIVGSLLVTYEWSDWRNSYFWWLQSVYVEEEYRQKGVFRSLFREVTLLAQSKAVCGLRLYAIRENSIACRSYEAMGMGKSHYLMFETLFEQDKREYELPLYIQPLSIQDRGWITTLLRNNWGTELIITRGKLHRAIDYPGFIAYQNKNKVGLVIYHIAGDECELVSLNSLREGIGVGGALVEAVKKKALLSGCKRLWLITTNDNLKAMAFYQKRGFRLVAVYPDAIRVSRRIKPEIPEIGSHNIPIRDEIELEILLEKI